MCSRYSLTAPPEAVRAVFGYRETPDFPPRQQIAPTEPIGVVVRDQQGVRHFTLMRWGLLPPFARDPKKFPTLINARAKGIASKPAFRKAFARRRCLVPADGFYEWTGAKGARRPFHLRPRVPGLVAFAGIWECWSSPDGGEIDTVAIITCVSSGAVAELHDRMPVVVTEQDFDAWLDCERTMIEQAEAMLRPAPEDLFEAIEMRPPTDKARDAEPKNGQPRQLQLF